MEPWLSVIIPTQGRPTLARTLKSVRDQRGPYDVEVLVVEDTHGASELAAERPAAAWRARHMAHDAGHHCWGHCQINAGLRAATGAFVAFQDDDDVFTEDCFDAIQHAIFAQEMPAPIMFQFRAYDGEVYWQVPRPVLSRVGGHCIVAPNVSNRLGTWDCRYEGDFDFIQRTLRFYPPWQVMWVPRVISQARPAEAAA